MESPLTPDEAYMVYRRIREAADAVDRSHMPTTHIKPTHVYCDSLMAESYGVINLTECDAVSVFHKYYVTARAMFVRNI